MPKKLFFHHTDHFSVHQRPEFPLISLRFVLVFVFHVHSTDVTSFFIIEMDFLPAPGPPVIIIAKIIGINDTPLLFTNGNK